MLCKPHPMHIRDYTRVAAARELGTKPASWVWWVPEATLPCSEHFKPLPNGLCEPFLRPSILGLHPEHIDHSLVALRPDGAAWERRFATCARTRRNLMEVIRV